MSIFREDLDSNIAPLVRAIERSGGAESAQVAAQRHKIKHWTWRETASLRRRIKGPLLLQVTYEAAMKLYAAGAHEEARQCFGLYLRDMLGDDDDLSIVDTVLLVARFVEREVTATPEIITALYMRAKSDFYAVLRLDPRLVERAYFVRAVSALDAMRDTMQLVVDRNDEDLCYLIYNGSRHMFELVEAMLPHNVPLRIVEYLNWCALCLDTSPPLLTAKYLPWKTRVYIAISRLYHQGSDFKAAAASISDAKHGGLTKVLRLRSLEEIDGKNIPIQKAYFIETCRRALATLQVKFDLLQNPVSDAGALEAKLKAGCADEQHAIYTLAEVCCDPRRRTMLNFFRGFGNHAGFDASKPREEERGQLLVILKAAFGKALPHLQRLTKYLTRKLPKRRRRKKKPVADEAKEKGDADAEGAGAEDGKAGKAEDGPVPELDARQSERSVPLETQMKLIRAAFSLRSWDEFGALVKSAKVRLDRHSYLSKLVVQKILPVENVTDQNVAVWSVECDLLETLAGAVDCKVDEDRVAEIVETMNRAFRTPGALAAQPELYEDTALFLWKLPLRVWLQQAKVLEGKLVSDETPEREQDGAKSDYRRKRDILIRGLVAVDEMLRLRGYPDLVLRSRVALECNTLLQLRQRDGDALTAKRVLAYSLRAVQARRCNDVLRQTKRDGMGLVHSICADFDMKVHVPPHHPLLPRAQASRRDRDFDVPRSRIFNLLTSLHTELLFNYFGASLNQGLDSATKRATRTYEAKVKEETYMKDFKSTFHPFTAKLAIPETNRQTETRLLRECGENEQWRALVLIQMASYRKEVEEQHELLRRAVACLDKAEEQQKQMLQRVNLRLVDTWGPTPAQQFPLAPPPDPADDGAETQPPTLAVAPEIKGAPHVKALAPPLLVARTYGSVVLRPIIPKWYRAKYKLRGFVVFGKEASTGTNVSQIDFELCGAGIEHPLPPLGENLTDVRISGLTPNIGYSFAVVGVDVNGDIVADRGAIGETAKPVVAMLPLPTYACWGILSNASAKWELPAPVQTKVTYKALQRFVRGSAQVSCMPLYWRDRLNFQSLDARAVYYATRVDVHRLVKVLHMRSDLYAGSAPSLVSGKYVAPLAHFELHTLKQIRPLLLALQAAQVAKDAEVTATTVERIYNALVPVLPESERAGVGPALAQAIIPCLLVSAELRRGLAPLSWTPALNRVTCRLLFELARLYEETGETGVVNALVGEQVELLSRAQADDAKIVAAAKKRADKERADFAEERAKALEDAKAEIEEATKEAEGRGESYSGPAAEEVAAERVPDPNVDDNPDPRDCYRAVPEDRALCLYLLSRPSLAESGSKLAEASWDSWIRLSQALLRGLGYGGDGWGAPPAEGDAPAAIAPPTTDGEAAVLKALQAAANGSGSYDDALKAALERKDASDGPMLLARVCEGALKAAQLDGTAASEKVLGWLSDTPATSIMDANLSPRALKGVEKTLASVVAEQHPTADADPLDTGVCSSDWLGNFRVVARVKPLSDPAGIVRKCGHASKDAEFGGFVFELRNGKVCFRVAGGRWVNGPAYEKGEWNEVACDYSRGTVTLSCGAKRRTASVGQIAENKISLVLAMGDVSRPFKGEIGYIRVLRIASDDAAGEKEQVAKEQDAKAPANKESTAKITPYALLWRSELERVRAMCLADKLLRLRAANLVKLAGLDPRRRGGEGDDEKGEQQGPSLEPLLSRCAYGAVGRGETADGWGLSAPRGLGWEWRLATEFAASNELRALGGEETTAAAATAAAAAAGGDGKHDGGDAQPESAGGDEQTEEEKKAAEEAAAKREEERKAVEAYDAEQKRMLREEALILFDMWRCVALGCVMASSARAWTQTHNLARQFWNSVSALRLSPADYVRLARGESDMRAADSAEDENAPADDQGAKAPDSPGLVDSSIRMTEALLDMLAVMSSPDNDSSYPGAVVAGAPEYAAAGARTLGQLDSADDAKNAFVSFKKGWTLPSAGSGVVTFRATAGADGAAVRLALSTEPKIGKKALIVEFSADGVQVLSPTLFADDEPSVVATSRQGAPGVDGKAPCDYWVRVDESSGMLTAGCGSMPNESASLVRYSSAAFPRGLTCLAPGGVGAKFETVRVAPLSNAMDAVPSRGSGALAVQHVEQLSLNKDLVTVEDSGISDDWYVQKAFLGPQMGWLSKLVLFQLEVLFHDKRWTDLVRLGEAFNFLTDDMDGRRVMKLLVYAQRELMLAARARMREKRDELDELNAKMDAKAAEILEKKKRLRSQRGKKEQDRLLAEERKKYEAVTAVLVPELERRTGVFRRMDDAFNQFSGAAGRTEAEMRKFLLVLEKSRFYLSKYFSVGPSSPTDGQAASGVSPETEGTVSLETTEGGTMSLTATIRSGGVSAGRVERTYKQSVQQLRQKRESVLMARALLELGSFFYARSETDAARQQWRAGVDCLFATLDAITTRRKIMYGQLVPAYSSHAPNVSTQKLPSYPVFLALNNMSPADLRGGDEAEAGQEDDDDVPAWESSKPSESLVERIGFWNCVTGLVLLGNIGQRTCGENIDYMRDNVFLGGALSASLFAGSLQHPVRLAEFRRCGVADVWPGFGPSLFASETRSRVGQVLDAARFISAQLIGAQQPVKALPVLGLYGYVSTRVCKSVPDAVFCRALRVRALADAGFFAEACAELVSIARAEGMPELPTGTSVVAMLKTDAAGDAAADVPRFENYAPLGSNGKVAAWLIGEECKLTDAAKQLFGPDLAAQFEIARCRILARMVRTSCSLHQFEATEPGDEPKQREACLSAALDKLRALVEAAEQAAGQGEPNIAGVRARLECFAQISELEEARGDLAGAVDAADRALSLLRETESIAGVQDRAARQIDTVLGDAPGMSEWLSTRCRVLELMLKQGRVEEADELAALILRESARVQDSSARARAGLAQLRLALFRGEYTEAAALARESWQMFVDGCDDPVPEFLKIIQSQKESKKTPVDLGEANDSLTRLSWVRSPTLAELPGLALEYGRGLLEVAAATSRLYSETGQAGPKWDALVMLEQAELVFKLVSSEFGVDVTPALMARLTRALKSGASNVAEAEAKQEAGQGAGEDAADGDDAKASYDAKAELATGVNTCLSKISSRPLLEPLNVHLPFMQNYLAGTLQLAGALAAQGSLDRAVAKATEGETLGLLCASRDPLWEARTHALIASSMWATTKRLEQTFSELVPVRRAILRKRAVEAEGAPQRRPTTSRPIPDTSEDDATVGLRERLRGIIRRLLAAVRAQIVLSNDHESIQDLLVTLSEVHRFAALNLPAEAKEGKGGDGEAKDDGEDAPVRGELDPENAKKLSLFFLLKAYQANRLRRALRHGVWDAKAPMAAQPIDEKTLPVHIRSEIRQGQALQRAYREAELSYLKRQQPPEPPADAKKGGKKAGKKGGKKGGDDKEGDDAPPVTSRLVLQHLLALRYQSSGVPGVAHFSKSESDVKIAAVHWFLKNGFEPYRSRCCFEDAGVSYAATDAKLGPSAIPSSDPEANFASWSDAAARNDLVCVQWARLKEEAHGHIVGLRPGTNASPNVSMVYAFGSGQAAEEGKAPSLAQGAKSLDRTAVAGVCGLATDLRVIIEEEAQEQRRVEQTDYKSTGPERERAEARKVQLLRELMIAVARVVAGLGAEDAASAIQGELLGAAVDDLVKPESRLATVTQIEDMFQTRCGVAVGNESLRTLIASLVQRSAEELVQPRKVEEKKEDDAQE